MKIAVVHDWLVTNAGAEKVLHAILDVYPESDVFSLVDFLSPKERETILLGKTAQTSFMQRLPFAQKYFRYYLPLFPLAIESLDLIKYDLVISSSWAVAKGVKTNKKQLHISYCHTPIRYAWDLYDVYTSKLRQPKKIFVQWTLKYIRRWDSRTSNHVTSFIANSSFVQERIQRSYNRKSIVIHPPVDTDKFILQEKKEEFYFTASRLVPYKKIKLIVEAFNVNGKILVVAGAGEELEEIRKIAKGNVTVLGYVDDDTMKSYMQNAKAFVFAALEDFGIIPVEAMSCGTPVIAYGRGGVIDTVIDGKTGVFFEEQSIDSLNSAIDKFIKLSFDSKTISEHAQSFSNKRFQDEFKNYVDEKFKDHCTRSRF